MSHAGLLGVGSRIARAEPVRASGEVIPGRFLWIADATVLILTLLVAHLVAPNAQRWVVQMDTLRRIAWLSVPLPNQIGGFRPPLESVALLFILVPATMFALQALGGYRPLLHQGVMRVVASCVLAPIFGVSVLSLIIFGLRVDRLSRVLVFVFALLAIAALLGYRLSLWTYKSARFRAGHYARRALVIGSSESARWLVAYVGRIAPSQHYRVVGQLSVLDESVEPLPAPSASTAPIEIPAPAPVLGPVGTLANLLIHSPIQEVIAVLGQGSSAWLTQVIETCDYYRVTLRIVPEALLMGTVRDLQVLYHSDAFRLPEVVLEPAGLDADALFVKRLLDIVVSAGLLVVLSPFFALIALAIKLTTPELTVFYPWRVVGDKGLPFTGYKFTTMRASADAKVAQQDLQTQNEMKGPVFKIKDDPRVTPFGRFLRKFSLNELPQLWSVLRGDMSLVGPRPAFPHELERYELWHKRKLSVKPGITCLWQVSGRNQISSFDDWVRMDLEYIDRWSFWLDLKILARTAWVVIRGTGS